MKDKASISHDEAMSKELREDPDFVAEYLRAAMEDETEPRALLVACALNSPDEQRLPETLTSRLAAFVQHAWIMEWPEKTLPAYKYCRPRS